MKRLIAACLVCLLAGCSLGCTIAQTSQNGYYVGGETSVQTPEVIMALPTPSPTPEPRVATYEMRETLFRRDGVSGTLSGVSYIENHSIALTVAFQNQTGQPLVFSNTAYGAVNGWALAFTLDGGDKSGTFTIQPQSSQDFTFATELAFGAAKWMQVYDIQTVRLLFSGSLGENKFNPASNTVVNPACEKGYVQSYGNDAPVLIKNEWTNFRFHELNSVSALLVVSAECLSGPCEMTVIPSVNGRALGAEGVTVRFSASGERAMMEIPLLKTLLALSGNQLHPLSLSVVMTQNGKPLGAFTMAIPQEGESADDAQAAQLTAAPQYSGSKNLVWSKGDVLIYGGAVSREPSDYYGKVTRFQVICVNNTAGILRPETNRLTLAGAPVEGAFSGYIPPYSVAQVELVVYGNVPEGARLVTGLQLLDCTARMKRVFSEELTLIA